MGVGDDEEEPPLSQERALPSVVWSRDMVVVLRLGVV